MALAAKSLYQGWDAYLANVERANQLIIHLKERLIVVRLRQTIRPTLGELMSHYYQGRVGRAKRINIEVRGTAKHQRKSLILLLYCGPFEHGVADAANV